MQSRQTLPPPDTYKEEAITRHKVEGAACLCKVKVKWLPRDLDYSLSRFIVEDVDNRSAGQVIKSKFMMASSSSSNPAHAELGKSNVIHNSPKDEEALRYVGSWTDFPEEMARDKPNDGDEAQNRPK